ncbi:MAG: hypothetical protein ACRD21_13345 [Vicinamibacteria bacterium]
MSTADVKLFEPPAIEHPLDESTPGQEGKPKDSLPALWIVSPVRISDTLELGVLRDARLRVIAPILVTFAEEEESVRACAVELDEFGFGASYGAALADLQHAIGELYFTLEEDQNRLGADLTRVWSVLQTKIQRRDATEAA